MTQTLGRNNSSKLNKPNKFLKYLQQKLTVQGEDKFRVIDFIISTLTKEISKSAKELNNNA